MGKILFLFLLIPPLLQLSILVVFQCLVNFLGHLLRDHVECCLFQVPGKLMKTFFRLWNGGCILDCFYIMLFFWILTALILALTGRNTLYRSPDPMSLNWTFWKLAIFVQNIEIECEAIIQIWFSADDINHKSLLVYEHQQQRYIQTELLPVYLIRNNMVLSTIQRYLIPFSNLTVNK